MIRQMANVAKDGLQVLPTTHFDRYAVTLSDMPFGNFYMAKYAFIFSDIMPALSDTDSDI